MTTASPPAAPGMPSEAIADALNHAARAMQRQFRSGGTEEEIEAAIWHHLGPAFEAKDRDIEWLRGFVSSSEAERYRRCAELSDRALSAEANLAQAVEALRPFADEENGVMQDLLWGDEPDSAIATITTRLGHIRAARAVVRRARSASNIGQNEGEKT